MNNEGLYKPSPLIKKILNQKFPKLDSDSLKNIVSTAKQMTKLIQPSGCSQNLKAEFQDPEKALEYSRRKNMIFDTYLKSELSQLNCLKYPIKAPSRKRKRFSKSLIQYSETKRPAQKNTDPSRLTQDQNQGRSYFSRQHFRKENSVLPPLIKSVPLHLDPDYSFTKKTLPKDLEVQQEKHRRISSLEVVYQKCDDFIPACKSEIQDLLEVQSNKKRESQRIQHYMEDFTDSIKISNDQKSFNDSMDTKVHNRRLNSKLEDELDSLRSNLLDITKRAIELGGKKIWRWRNKLFLAETDKLINSVPSMRK